MEATIAKAAEQFGSSGYVAESVPLALFAAQRAEQLGFTVMLEEVIAAGGDTDTNASIAGQVAGAALGIKKLPNDLVAMLPELVLRTARAFAEAAVEGK